MYFCPLGENLFLWEKNDVVIQSKSKYILLLIFLEFYDPHLGIIEWTVHDNTGNWIHIVSARAWKEKK